MMNVSRVSGERPSAAGGPPSFAAAASWRAGVGFHQGRSVPSRPPKEVGFSQGPSRPEKTTCDGRRSSNAEDPKPTVADAGGHWRNTSSEFPALESKWAKFVQFIPKRELERARLVREARAIYESIFPTEKAAAS